MNAIDFKQICRTIYDWIDSTNQVKSQRIYEEDPNVDRPATPYVTFDFLTGPVKVGSRDNLTYSGSGTDFFVQGPRDFTMTIKSYGEEAMQIMSNLHASLELQSVTDIFRSGNIAVRNAGTVQRINQLLETGIEERYQMDIIFGATSCQTEDLGEITTVRVDDGRVVDVDGDVKDVQTFEMIKP